MEVNNEIYQVLAVSGNAIAAGSTPDALTSGEWGIFNYETGKSIDGTASANIPNKFFFASRDTDGILRLSSGQGIQLKGMRSIRKSVGTSEVGQQITLNGLTLLNNAANLSNNVFGVKLDFRGNTEVYERFGMNQASKVFMGDVTCDDTTKRIPKLIEELIIQVANDTDKFINLEVTGTGPLYLTHAVQKYTYDTINEAWTVFYNDGTSDTSASITQDAVLAEIDLHGGDDLALVFIMTNFSEIYAFCNVNPKYFKSRQIKAIPSLVGGTCAWGTVAETTPMVYATNLGYDIQELEYLAGGWNGMPGPYRQSGLHGLPFNKFHYQISTGDAKSIYNITTVEYDNESVGGWQTYKNSAATFFVIKEGVSTNLDTIIASVTTAANL